MNWFGLFIGVAAFFVIGLGFVWVIRGERYFGYLWWPYVMALGAVVVVASLLFSNDWIAALVGAVGASLLWGATELKEQAVRAELGWFPFRKQKLLPPGAEVIKKWPAPHL